MTKAIVTVVGHDTLGIIAKVSTLLFENGVNILDISQTVMSEYFTMVMLTDVSKSTVAFDVLRAELKALGEQMHLSMRIQHQEIFDAMHAID